MRTDSVGLFWADEEVKKVLKEKVKCTPPERTWERPDYLPGLEEALAFVPPLLTDQELYNSVRRELIFDIEVYQNYFLIALTSYTTGRMVYFERTPDRDFDTHKLRWVVDNFCLVGFNSRNYDAVILQLALAGCTNEELKAASDAIILYNMDAREVLSRYKAGRSMKFDHIDLIEVAPLRANLKIYGGRLHTPRMQDLPFHPHSVLSDQQIAIVRWYCCNDLTHTALLRSCLTEQINLRKTMGIRYGLDLRSKSDAQIAEAVIAQELEQINRRRPIKPEIAIGTTYRYQVPPFLQYQTDLMQWVLWRVANTNFVVADHGSIEKPPELKDFTVQIGKGVYRMGIGGLHSTESCAGHVTDDTYFLADRDVSSQYPAIILGLNLFPQHLGTTFLHVYRNSVNQRLAAKKAKDKSTAESLKVLVNGVYGKLGSKYSVFYSPDLLIQVTLTGQLSVLMMIERLELAGIEVVSGNTDGITIKCRYDQKDLYLSIIEQWEKDTGVETEETLYRCLYSRDVNNYVAVKADGSVKGKGFFANPWSDPKSTQEKLHKNPVTTVCIEAVEKLLVSGVPIEQTIYGCTDIRKFVEVRTVRSGAVKDGVYLGKAVRWYYAKGEEGTILVAATGGKVPRSQGARPLMQLPASCPSDVDYEWYVNRTNELLADIGYLKAIPIEKPDEETVEDDA